KDRQHAAPTSESFLQPKRELLSISWASFLRHKSFISLNIMVCLRCVDNDPVPTRSFRSVEGAVRAPEQHCRRVLRRLDRGNPNAGGDRQMLAVRQPERLGRDTGPQSLANLKCPRSIRVRHDHDELLAP